MKKLKKRWIIGVFIILLLAGIGGKLYMDKQTLNNEMIEIVKSDEAKRGFEEELKSLDPKALTQYGVIKSYEIDYDSIEHNPMGGIMVDLIINNNKELKVYNILDKNNSDNTLKNSGAGYTGKLDELLINEEK